MSRISADPAQIKDVVKHCSHIPLWEMQQKDFPLMAFKDNYGTK